MSKRIHRQVLAGVLCAGVTITQASAELDPKTRGSMQHLYKSLVLAEQNLKLAADQKDFPRAALANDLLFSYQRLSGNIDTNACIDALNGLSGVATAIAFAVHPITEDPFDRFSNVMRPSDDMLVRTYSEGWALYESKLAECEEEIKYRRTRRLLPEKMPLLK